MRYTREIMRFKQTRKLGVKIGTNLINTGTLSQEAALYKGLLAQTTQNCPLPGASRAAVLLSSASAVRVMKKIVWGHAAKS
jgi:hypothetical protein